MGQIVVPGSPPSIIISAVDRTVAANADGGVAPAASHIILIGESAGANLSVSNIIAMGDHALAGAFADVRLTGTIVIGEQHSLGATTINGGLVDPAGALTVLGSAVGPNLLFAGSSVLIGDHILDDPGALGASGNALVQAVIIGSRAAKNQWLQNVGGNSTLAGVTVLGYGALSLAAPGDIANQAAFTGTVAIGNNALSGLGGGVGSVSFGNSVYIGSGAGLGSAVGGGGNCSSTVVIGGLAGQGNQQFKDCVVVGFSAVGNSRNDNIIAIGARCGVTAPTGGNQILIGSDINGNGAVVTASRNIMMGNGCNPTAVAHTNKFIVEMNDNIIARQCLFFGDLTTGSLAVGVSTQGTDRDLPGTNILKLLNGTNTGAAPGGGGFFQAVAGELFWTASTNVRTQLSQGTAFTVATLPGGAFAGQRAYVSNAAAPVFAAAPVGGGAIFTPVYFDGAGWRCG